MEWQTKQIRRTYNRLGLGMLAYLLIYQFLSLPLMMVVKLLCPQLLSSSWFGLLLGELVQYAVALPVCWWIAKSANTPQRPLSRRKLSVSCFFKYLLLSIGLLFLFNLIGTAVNELLSQLKGSPAGNLIEQSVGSYTLWQMVLVTVISAPLGEELLFRKLVYRCVGAVWGQGVCFHQRLPVYADARQRGTVSVCVCAGRTVCMGLLQDRLAAEHHSAARLCQFYRRGHPVSGGRE